MQEWYDGSRVLAWTVSISTYQGNSHGLYSEKWHTAPRFFIDYLLDEGRKSIEPGDAADYLRKEKMKSIKLFAITLSCLFVACGGQSSSDYSTSSMFQSTSTENQSTSSTKTQVQYLETDYVKTFYLISNPQKFASGAEYTTDDLKESGSLLFSQNGIVKAIEFSNGWKKVNHFTKRTAVPNMWWLYMVYYEDEIFKDEEHEIDVYLPM